MYSKENQIPLRQTVLPMLVVVCYVSKKDLYLDIWFHSIPDILQPHTENHQV